MEDKSGAMPGCMCPDCVEVRSQFNKTGASGFSTGSAAFVPAKSLGGSGGTGTMIGFPDNRQLTPRMNQSIKAQWLEALRSGKYSQGKGMLCGGENYCCLGVLTDIYTKEIGVEWVRDAAGRKGLYKEVSALPMLVAEWAGFGNHTNPLVMYRSDMTNRLTVTSLATLNDRHTLSFLEIADVIETQL